ncbi:hypothetical protein TWF751_006273 [Orbilia oligospora]|nr:hypothetical protein TWF751_006273 [Orbilia oligospora]
MSIGSIGEVAELRLRPRWARDFHTVCRRHLGQAPQRPKLGIHSIPNQYLATSIKSPNHRVPLSLLQSYHHLRTTEGTHSLQKIPPKSLHIKLMRHSSIEVLPEAIKLKTPFVLPPQRRNMDVRTKLIGDRCKVCGCATNACCKRCKVVFYCSEMHRQRHAEKHNEACLEIEAAKLNVGDAERAFAHNTGCPERKSIRGMIASIYNGKAPSLENKCLCTGQDHAILFARFNLIRAYIQVNTKCSVVNACNVAIETQYLGRCDPMVIRCITANLMIRVGNKQNAYDFIKYWLVNGDQYVCTTKNPEPFLDIRNADAFEPCKNLFDAFEEADMDPPTSFLVPLALLKFKLLADIKQLRNLQLLRTKLPFDVVYLMKPFFHTTDIMKNRKDIRLIDTVSGYDKLIKTLENDLDLLFEIVGRAFEGRYVVWRCFFEKSPVKQARRYSEEVQTVYKYSADAWMETKGGYEWILGKLADACNKKLTAENCTQAAIRVAALYKALRSQYADDDSDDEYGYYGEDSSDDEDRYYNEDGYYYDEYYDYDEEEGEEDGEAGDGTHRNIGINENGYKIDYDLMYQDRPYKEVYECLSEGFGFGFD